ncbi:MAG: hypothetical protein AABW87_00635 [Nanoarchaeota archaeon]
MSLFDWLTGNVMKRSLDKAEAAVTQRLKSLKKNIIKTVLFLFFLLMGIALIINGLLKVLTKVLPIEYLLIIVGVISILIARDVHNKDVQ